jgi:hypothetical protein
LPARSRHLSTQRRNRLWNRSPCGPGIRLAFSLIDPTWFPEPAWLLGADAIEARDLDLVLRAAEQHRAAVEALATPQEKLAYLAGVLDFEEMNAMRLAGE